MPSTVRLNSSGSAVTALKGAAGVDAQREEELEAKRVREVRTVHCVGCRCAECDSCQLG